MKHLYVATPTYDNVVSAGYCQSMVMTLMACTKAGIGLSGPDFKGGPYIECNRNWLVHRFLVSGADALLFVDADVTWDESAVVRLYDSGLDFVGGAYPKKQEIEEFPVKPLTSVNGRYREVLYLPGGFQLIRRHVFEKLKQVSVTYPSGEDTIYAFYRNIYEDGGFCGEDILPCARWRNMGGKVWCDTDIDFGHQGMREWRGNYSKFLAIEPHLVERAA